MTPYALGKLAAEQLLTGQAKRVPAGSLRARNLLKAKPRNGSPPWVLGRRVAEELPK